jgi:hypothetical protein
MKRLWMLCCLCVLAAVPATAFAQQGPPGGGGPPSPQQQAAMEKARADAKSAAYAALTPAHAASVNAIVAQVVAGTLDRRAAGGQIDALLTPDEQKAVLAAAANARDAMRAARGAGAPPPPAGGPPPGGPPGPGGGRFGPPSAGRFLLMVSMAPGQRRGLQPRPRSSSAP